jgi:hypothetical protein
MSRNAIKKQAGTSRAVAKAASNNGVESIKRYNSTSGTPATAGTYAIARQKKQKVFFLNQNCPRKICRTRM